MLDSNISHESHIKQILKSTVAIAFIGTPHCGSDKAEWASIGSKLLGLVPRLNKDIVQALAPESAVLARIQQDFHRMLAGLPEERKIRITCFFEELPIQGIGKVNYTEMICNCFSVRVSLADILRWFPSILRY